MQTLKPPPLLARCLLAGCLLAGCDPARLEAPRLGAPPQRPDGGPLASDRGPVSDGAGFEGAADARLPQDARPPGPERGPPPDAGPQDAALPDPGPPDAGPPDAAPDPCPAGCGPNARCTPQGCRCEPGFVPEGAGCVPADPCAAVDCAPTARCEAGACVCRAGFVPQGPDCVPEVQSPLELRTEAEVCGQWRGFVGVGRDWAPTPGAEQDPCDPGQILPEAQDAAVARTNLYRWLVGLPPVGLDAARIPTQQACAATLAALGSLSHNLTPEMPCYTREAAAGAGSSNLAMGVGVVGSVDLYVGDRGVPSLGHRRWVFNPGMAVTAFGVKQGLSCMYAFSMGGAAAVDFVSWPPPGVVPVDAAQGTASVTLHRLRAGPDFEILAAVDGGPAASVAAVRPGGGYGGGDTFAFPWPAGAWAAGRAVEITLRGLRDAPDQRWTTRFVRCP